ncbi:SDR family NAD(P)-dependent oxidoreductase [Rhodanobacter sp. DHG33]|uniref:SDR family NAD(P)-dependent oxidoreductase n=1 Tax=Rhodanobacter sp. DHG33 TaxID=2775921 RepID=UPI00177BC524|nr:SDR family NAD(P)-dependent oxidoreductase [Rhodanobacter sp. DHG33]MBD8898806.1 SDR family NAD(P)-dependent oxidoreductase [Rhodanobacter sp. DHG33]
MSRTRQPAAQDAPPISGVHRVALVSGANRGLGFEVARQLAARGYSVLLGARDLAKGRHAAKQIAGDVTAVPLDITDATQIAELAAWIEREHGRLDVLVNNAGGYADSTARAESAGATDVRAALETNLLGAWQLSSAVLPLMRRHRYGRIVNVTSGCAGVTAPDAIGYPAYRVSKAALNAYTRALAAELAGSGILVNAVCPGWLATGLGGPGGGPVERGAASVVAAACQPEPGINGALLRDGQRIAW